MSKSKMFLVLLITLVLTCGALAGHAQGPSFDCNKARSATAIQICLDPSLSAKDRTMATAYHAVLQQLTPNQTVVFRRAHLVWFKRYQAACGGSMEERERVRCIGTTLDARTAELQQLIPKPQAPSKAYSAISACFSAGALEVAASVIFAILVDIITGADIDWDDLLGSSAEAGLKPCISAAIKQIF